MTVRKLTARLEGCRCGNQMTMSDSETQRPATDMLSTRDDIDDSSGTKDVTATSSASEQQMSLTRMQQKLDRVQDIWKEFAEEWGTTPPIRELDEKYGNRWRHREDRNRYADRMLVVNAVQHAMSNCIGPFSNGKVLVTIYTACILVIMVCFRQMWKQP